MNKSRSMRLLFIGGAIAGIVLMTSYVGMQMYVLSIENKIRAVRREKLKVVAKIQTRELTIAELKKGTRIKRIASEKLGMKVPEGAPDKLF